MRLKSEMGSYDFHAQYQQSPAPLGGGIVKWDWFQTYDEPQTFHCRYGVWPEPTVSAPSASAAPRNARRFTDIRAFRSGATGPGRCKSASIPRGDTYFLKMVSGRIAETM